MRQRTLLVLAMLIGLSSRGLTQTFFTVNNMPNSPANYHSLQNAIDSVAEGSILLLQPSAISYGYATIRKRIAIFGPGYFLGQNPAPNTQAKLSRSLLAHLSFGSGSQGSLVSGLSFGLNPALDGSINERISVDSTSNITVSRCYFDYVPYISIHNRVFLIQNSSNITICQSFFNLQETILQPANCTGIEFKNNIFLGTGDINFTSGGTQPFSYTFTNNSIYFTLHNVDFGGGTFINNIIMKDNFTIPTNVTGSMVFADRNVSNLNIFPSTINNLIGISSIDVYVGNNVNNSSQDAIWQLKPASPARGYGNDGTDCGAYGGAKPYVLSGIPAIPNIYFADPQSVGTGVGGLNIHLKIKANN